MKGVAKQTRKCWGIAVCLLFAAGLIMLTGTMWKADAQTETLEEKIIRFTNSDLLDGETEGGETIQSFAVKYKRGNIDRRNILTDIPLQISSAKLYRWNCFIQRAYTLIWVKSMALSSIPLTTVDGLGIITLF